MHKTESTKKLLSHLSDKEIENYFDNLFKGIAMKDPNLVSKLVLDAAMRVHTFLGAGLLKAQILTYLRLSGITLGLLLNFNSVHLKDGIIRVINSH